MFWTSFFLTILIFGYLYLGSYCFVVTEQFSPHVFPAPKAEKQVTTLILFAFIVFWPIFTGYFCFTNPWLLNVLISYERRIRLLRWVFVLGCIWALAHFGPRISQHIRPAHIQDEEPMAAPLVTSNDTVRERPQVPHTRYEWYSSDYISD